MRVRHKPWAKEMLESHPEYVSLSPEYHKGKWHSVFKNDNPIHLEIGSGKGQFIVNMAKQNPQINFIGIEMFDSVLVTALQRALEEDLPNLKLIRMDGREITTVFDQGEITKVYLNFSDPWPKNRHEKRRLTYASFLKTYQEVLTNNGKLQFKTDNQKLFEYSLCSLSQYEMILEEVSLNLHQSQLLPDNVMTEYEEKFSGRGQAIYYLLAHF